MIKVNVEMHPDTSFVKVFGRKHKLSVDTLLIILDDIKEGKKIAAVKRLKEHTGLGLKEAKDEIDEFIKNITKNVK